MARTFKPLVDSAGNLRLPVDACPLKRNWAAAKEPQVRGVLAAGYGAGYGAGDTISIVFERPTAAGLDEDSYRGDRLLCLLLYLLLYTYCYTCHLHLPVTAHCSLRNARPTYY